MKRYTKIAIMATMAYQIGYAQDIVTARQKTEHERYEEANKEFQTLVNTKTANLGEIYYFMGENFYRWDEPQQANQAWKDGQSKDPQNSFAKIGQAKMQWINGDTAQANAIFEEILKDTKRKNAEIIRQIAGWYINAPVKNLEAAVVLLDLAIKLEPKNQENYLLLGDAQTALNPRNSSEAMKSYNKAADLHNDAKVVVRKAKIYQRAQNPKLADSLYAIAQEIEPNYAPAYRERAELNFQFAQHKQAIQNWEKYLQLNDSEYARYRYATSLFEQKQYDQTIEQLDILQQRGFENMYTKRMFAYASYEINAKKSDNTEALTQGLRELNELLENTPKDKIIGYDYRYKALYNRALGDEDTYRELMEKAAEIDSLIADEIYAELGKYFMAQKNYDLAIEIFNKKMGENPKKLSLAEHYDLARAYFFGPKDYEKCDFEHAYIIEQRPDYAVSYFWRGRANARLDTTKTTFAGKPYYEQFLELVSEDEKTGNLKTYTIEAYAFLGDYYISSPEKDLEKAAQMWENVQAIDPENKLAKTFFNQYKKK